MSTQPNPSDGELDEAVELLMATSRLMTAIVARTLADVHQSVTVPQLRVLVMLHGQGPMNLTPIAAALGVNPSNATRTCDRLVAAGLVRREADPSDRRTVAVTLTPKGRRLVDSLLDARRAVLAEVAGHLRPADRRALTKGLGAFLDAVPQTSQDHDDGGALLTWVR
ncbi:MAG TPA: MarR family transcriptional regulator [Nocardioides sp.]|nr:MarR family transcriptional regulator [Nocardioides sp.]